MALGEDGSETSCFLGALAGALVDTDYAHLPGACAGPDGELGAGAISDLSAHWLSTCIYSGGNWTFYCSCTELPPWWGAKRRFPERGIITIRKSAELAHKYLPTTHVN